MNDLVALIQKMGFWDICSQWHMPGLLHQVLANAFTASLPVAERVAKDTQFPNGSEADVKGMCKTWLISEHRIDYCDADG